MTKTLYLDGFEEVQDLLDGVSDDFHDIDYTNELVAELDLLAELHSTFFQSETGPDEAAWPANARSTIKRKGHSRILRGIPSNNYRLSRSLREKGSQSSGDAVREAIQTDTGGYLSFGTAVEYSAAHDRARGNIPARRHVGMNGEHLDGITERVTDYTIKQLQKM